MKMKIFTKISFLLICTFILWSVTTIAQDSSSKAAAPDGAKLYEQNCAVCHDKAEDRTPPKTLIARRSADEVIAALTSGSMRTQAATLTPLEIRALAVYLTGKPPTGNVDAAQLVNRCTGPAGPINLKAPGWNGWGNDAENTHFQPKPGLKAEDVSRLKLKWAYAYPGTTAVGQATVIGNRLFITTGTGEVVSLNAQTGCTYWTTNVGAAVRTAVSVGALPPGSKAKFAAYFGDGRANVYAVNAETGEQLWKINLDTHPVARITGAPILHGNRLYVPISSVEEVIARSEKYECCKFRGSIAAVDSYTGKLIWKSYAITEEMTPYKKNSIGTQLYGPAGAAIWSTPTLDLKRGVLYAGTGNSYTDALTGASDAVIAFDLVTGKIRWVNQVLPNDNFIMNCRQPGTANCPVKAGPDYDFGSSPVLRKLPNGKDVLLAGNKGGILFAFDPDNQGKKLWETKVGAGTALGGIEWGFAVDAKAAYVPVADPLGLPANRIPGLTAVNIINGEKLWHVPAPEAKCAWGTARCTNALSAAATVIPGIVFSGSSDGHLRAYATGDGKIVWDIDTAAQPYKGVNGKEAKGGAVDGGAPTIVNGLLYVNSGFAGVVGMGGNALLVFSVDGK